MQCGKKQPEDAKYCKNCGARLIPAEQVICPRCGKVIPRGRLCLHCGFLLTEPCSCCGAELLGNERFCPACGQPVGDADDTGRTR